MKSKLILTFFTLLVLLTACPKKENTNPTPTPEKKPLITSFLPASGEVGAEVTITGENFSTVLAENIVKFNTTTATIIEATANTLKVSVPVGATTGKISVQVKNEKVSSDTDFIVTVPIPPVITSFSPTSGRVGTTVTIVGENFNTTLANNIVKIGDISAIVTVATSSSLTITIPNGSTKGKISVQIGSSAPTFSANDFITSSFIDVRDNQEYGQVYIGSQLWMSRNLNFDTASDDYCYNDDPLKCTQYGKLYLWSTASTACPAGWRLPSHADFTTMVSTLGGNPLAKPTLINGGSSGMNMLYAGFRDISGPYTNEGTTIVFPSSTDDVAFNTVKGFSINASSANITYPSANKNAGFCVRCIKN